MTHYLFIYHDRIIVELYYNEIKCILLRFHRKTKVLEVKVEKVPAIFIIPSQYIQSLR